MKYTGAPFPWRSPHTVAYVITPADVPHGRAALRARGALRATGAYRLVKWCSPASHQKTRQPASSWRPTQEHSPPWSGQGR